MNIVKFLTLSFCVLNLNIYALAHFDKVEEYTFNNSWKFAEESKLHEGKVKLCRSTPKSKTICINAGHGSPEGQKYKFFCHPDHSPKLISGSTKSGKLQVDSVSHGCVLKDGTQEYDANLVLSLIIKDVLLENGYSVLMIREDNNCNFDNIARTLFANNLADCHIAIHYDSTESDKGAFYLSVPDVDSYKSMEPVKSHWRGHESLGKSLIDGLRNNNVKIFGNGNIQMDLVQTSYSTVPSIDLEVGDKITNRSESFHRNVAKGIVDGLNKFFGNHCSEIDTINSSRTCKPKSNSNHKSRSILKGKKKPNKNQKIKRN